MPQTYLQTLVTKITAAIDRAVQLEHITDLNRRELYKALFFLLAGDPILRPELHGFCKQHKKMQPLKELLKTVGHSVKLPQALHANTTKNVSLRKARNLWKVQKSDLDLIKEIAQVAGVDTEAEQHLLRRYYSSLDLHWLAEVEEKLDEVEVILSTQALEDILMGVLETYKVPKSKREPYSEVFGLCLGMASRHKETKKGIGTRTKWFVSVEKAVPQIRARAKTDSVTPNSKSIEAVVETASSIFPQLEIIGDYHSHPYRNIKRLKEVKGWEASDDDFKDIKGMYRSLRSHPKRKHRMRVTFVIAIAKGKSGSKSMTHMRGMPSVLKMSIAGCHIFISVYRILSNGGVTNKGVTLVRNMGESYFKAV